VIDMLKRMAGLALVSMLVSTSPGLALSAPRTYDNGAVWEVSYVTTKPGHFDDYLAYLAGPWRAQQEALKAKGVVLDYKVLNLADARDNEPDLMLLVEWKSMAAFDAPLAEQDAVTNQVFGSVDAATKAGMDREAIRHVGSDVLTRELILKPAK
jgi:hypothetical protein